ncbi:MAG: glycosyltransferase family 2 protein [Bacteroidota bacterium]|nr:glycosyltransferase family 2 protein [Bacteroidota bacterium]
MNTSTRKLSLVIPAYNEEGSIETTIRAFHEAFKRNTIIHELLVINDNSKDSTESILVRLEAEIKELKHINNTPPNGFGFAVKKGLESYSGDYVVLVMADMSDDPEDAVKMFNKAIEGGYDAVFGSRFIKGGATYDYPVYKMFFNRIINNLLKVMFWMRYNDTTNAFKLYKRETMDGLKPFLSHHFNLTVELPLKAIVRGYTYAVVPNSWRNRKTGVAKLKLKEMGSRYFFIIL